MISDEETAVKLLGSALQAAVTKMDGEAVMFSGGVDSSLISALARNGITLYAVGLEGSHDLRHAEYTAELLDLEDNLRIKIITQKEIEENIPNVIHLVKSAEPMAVEIGLSVFIASKEAHNDGTRVMLSGQGADELFAGYQRYIRIFQEGKDALVREIRKDVENLVETGIQQDCRIASANSIELRTPYLDQNVIEIGLRISPELKIRKIGGSYKRKYILRRVAENIIPYELAWKEKKAMQYGTGLHRELGKLARAHGFRNSKQYLCLTRTRNNVVDMYDS
jgi:asparagine synthase (glutamine-hydrolysing)